PEPACTPGEHPATGFAPVSAAAAVTKVKNLLVGLGPTDAEIAAVAADPAALSDLVAGWMALPQYAAKMQRFFVSSFQQDQFSYPQLLYLFMEYFAFQVDSAKIVQNVQEVFARTVMQLIAEGRPLTEAMTTTRFMMTPATMAAYAILDNVQVDDRHNRSPVFQREHPTSLTLQSEREIPIEDSVDPASPDFMVFYHPGLATAYGPGCPAGPVVYPAPVPYEVVADLFYGFRPSAFGAMGCQPPMLPPSARLVRPGDFTDWRMVTIRPPRAGEATTGLYDLPSFRAGGDLVLNTPRVGFFTTPAFFARWPTNNSNLARVLINQTMIVALGRPIDLSNLTAPPSLAAIDLAHSDPTSTCYGCHVSLDPMRQFFRHTFSLYGSPQADLFERSMTGQFGFHGASAAGTSIGDLGAQLAAHLLFAAAWTQRLCTYATSSPCDEGDPEFVRLVGVFRDSHHSWPALVRAMFSSPLVSYLAETRSAVAAGQPFPIARQEHLCATLSARLGVVDLCGLDVSTDNRSVSAVARTLATSWPSGQYSRGNALPSLAVAPSALMRGGMESICADLARRHVDNGAPDGFASSDPPAAVRGIVTRLMGLTGARVAGPEAILRNHYEEALAAGVTPTEALQSTFVLGCLSPFVAGVGQ
ncbi:MAG: hypothetical protein JWM10_5160, partial [Myxococcaceae bacterium]|nr:hypothetical protein [Myxococcaceae bacterium]